MLDGYAAGRWCTTKEYGYCQFDPIVYDETFTARVTKSGYRTTTFTYRVDPHGNHSSVVVTLPRDGS